MKKESETLLIPLYGKAYASKRKLILHDPKAEEILKDRSLDFSKTDKSRGLALYLAMRAAVMDQRANMYLAKMPGCAVLHLGCGLDARVLRVHTESTWYDIDLPSVIALRKNYYQEDDRYQMIEGFAGKPEWLKQIDPAIHTAVVIAEGLSMYLKKTELSSLILALQRRFDRSILLMDAYSKFAANISKYKNPVNRMGAKVTYGLDHPEEIERLSKGIQCLSVQNIAPPEKIAELSGWEKIWFRTLYANSLAKKLYQIYEFDIRI